MQLDGTGWCWGDNQYDAVANGAPGNGADQLTPFQQVGTWASLSPSPSTCGLQPDSSGWCWGFNQFGQVGNGLHGSANNVVDTPFELDGTWSSLTAGWTTVGIQTDGTGWVWGWGDGGEVGDGTTGVHHYVDSPYRLP